MLIGLSLALTQVGRSSGGAPPAANDNGKLDWSIVNNGGLLYFMGLA